VWISILNGNAPYSGAWRVVCDFFNGLCNLALNQSFVGDECEIGLQSRSLNAGSRSKKIWEVARQKKLGVHEPANG
jgi:hypothetical protein